MLKLVAMPLMHPEVHLYIGVQSPAAYCFMDPLAVARPCSRNAPRSPALLLTRCRVPLAPDAGTSASAICHETHRGDDHGCAQRMVVILSEAGVHSLRRALGTLEEIHSGGPGS